MIAERQTDTLITILCPPTGGGGSGVTTSVTTNLREEPRNEGATREGIP